MKRRLLVSYLSITTFVLLILAVPFGVSYANSVERRLTSDIQHDAFALAIRAQESIDIVATNSAARGQLQQLAANYRRDAGGRVVIVDSEGKAIADSDRVSGSDAARNFWARPEIMRALKGSETSGIASSGKLDEEFLYVALPVGSGDPRRRAHHLSGVARRRPHPTHLVAARGHRWRRARHRLPRQPAARPFVDVAPRRARTGGGGVGCR